MTIRESLRTTDDDECGVQEKRKSRRVRSGTNKDTFRDLPDHTLVFRAQQGAEDAVEVLLLRYRGLVKSIAARICRRSPALYGSYEDLTQEGMIGLWDAIMRHEPFHGALFRTYAVRRIRGAIYDAIRQNSETTRDDVQKINRAECVRTKLSRELLREPTLSEWRNALPQELQGDLDRIRENKARVYPLEEGEDGLGGLDAVPCEEEWSPEYRVLAEEEEHVRNKFMKLLLRCVPRVLSPSERVVFNRRIYGKGEKPMKLARVGKLLGVTESRACQLSGEIPSKIRDYMCKYHQKETRTVLEFVQ